MQATAKGFVVLMMMGMMAGVTQFVGYLMAMGVADDPASFSSWANWLGPFRELALGLILAGIALVGWAVGMALAIAEARCAEVGATSRRSAAPMSRP